MLIKEKVIQWCKENNTTISALERKCDIGNGTIGKWGKNGRLPSLDVLIKISKETGISLDDLIKNQC